MDDRDCGDHHHGDGGFGLLFLWYLLFADRRRREAAAEYRACPYCAEPVRWQAMICRFCGSDIPAVQQPRRRDLTTRAAMELLGIGLGWALLVCAVAVAVLALSGNWRA